MYRPNYFRPAPPSRAPREAKEPVRTPLPAYLREAMPQRKTRWQRLWHWAWDDGAEDRASDGNT
jgi:hypothetical protein